MIKIDNSYNKNTYFFSHDEINQFPIAGNIQQLLYKMRRKEGFLIHVDSIIYFERASKDIKEIVGDTAFLSGFFVAKPEIDDEDDDFIHQKIKLYPTFYSRIGDELLGSGLHPTINSNTKKLTRLTHYIELDTNGLKSLRDSYINEHEDNQKLRNIRFNSERDCDKLLGLLPKYHSEDIVIDTCREYLKASTFGLVLENIRDRKKVHFLNNTNFFISKSNEIWVDFHRFFEYGHFHKDDNFSYLIANIEINEFKSRKIKLNHIFNLDPISVNKEQIVTGFFNFKIFTNNNLIIELTPLKDSLVNGTPLTSTFRITYDNVESFISNNNLQKKLFRTLGGVEKTWKMIKQQSPEIGRHLLWSLGHQTGITLNDFIKVIKKYNLMFDESLSSQITNELKEYNVDIQSLLSTNRNRPINPKSIIDNNNNNFIEQALNILAATPKKQNIQIIESGLIAMQESAESFAIPVTFPEFYKYILNNNASLTFKTTPQKVKLDEDHFIEKENLRQAYDRIKNKVIKN